MGYTKRIISSLALVFVLQQLVAQQVLITIGVTPPFSPYLSNYTSTDANKIFMTLQNTTARAIQVRLTGSAVGDNGVSIKSKPGFVSSGSITLAPFQVRQMNGSALSEVFDLNNFDVTGIDRNTLARTLRLPEGNYNLCVQAVDYNSGQVLSGGAPLGCTLLSIAYPEPPVLVSPLPGDSVNAATPQALVFTWMNPGSVPVGTEYTIQIQEIPAGSVRANPNQVLNAASFPLLSQRVKTTSYVYSVGNLALKKGSKYAWRIVASDPSGRITFKNNGISAAGVFGYGRSEPVLAAVSRKEAQAPPKIVANKLEVTGTLQFQYHLSAQGLPADFKGVKTETLPLANEQVQLCYGLCRVKMNLAAQVITKVVANSSLKNTTLPQGVQVVPAGKDSSKLTFSHIDSIPVTGLPFSLGSVEPAGNIAGGLGQVIATATTDETGSYTFSAYTNKWCSIAGVENDNTAFVYCYYINVKNKHYSDPRNYIYVQVENANNPVAVGFSKLFLDNYRLTVHANRVNEVAGIGQKTTGVTTENNNDRMADVYVLRKIATGGNSEPPVPASEGDNIGHAKFVSQAPKKPAFTLWSNYAVVAKRTVLTEKGNGADENNTYGATASFHNLIPNLDNKESYYVYVEYKNAGVYFDPKECHFEPEGTIDEYRPAFVPETLDYSVSTKPSYVSVRVKGVLKYQFKNGTPAPLANVSVSFRSILWTAEAGTKKYNYDDPGNKTFATTTTNANGYFELSAGTIDYDKYNVNNAWFLGIDQFVTVNSCYYGSPDKSFHFEAGNDYNVGELVAQVKDYTISPVIQGKNVQNGLMEKLQGQRTYLCRKAGVNPQAWGVPANEGSQKDIPSKQIKDIDGTVYNVIAYGETDAAGKVKFENLVANDAEKSDDQYYLYSESGITSVQNFSTQYGKKAGVTWLQEASWGNYYTKRPFVFNAVVRKESYGMSPVYDAVALAPYIEGGVYPKSNTSTNALPGVQVYLYDITGTTAAAFETQAKSKGAFAAVISAKAKLQDNLTTTSSGVFYFNLAQGGSYKGWKLLLYSKAGFISGYTVIYSGKPMVAGTKQTVKGFLLPPQLVHVTIKDEETGSPVEANVVVGDQFSWASQIVLSSLTSNGNGSYSYKNHTPGVDLTTPYGDVSFKVVPEDNVRYRTQTFTRNIKMPVGVEQATVVTQTLADFEMTARKNRVIVCLLDAATSKGLAGTVKMLDIPAAVNPAAQPVFLLKDHCKEFSFAANQPTYRVQVSSNGYATQTITVKNNTDDEFAQDLLVKMQPGLDISGAVTVDGKAVKDAKVYIQELPSLGEVLTDAQGHYSMAGLPKNDKMVTLTAVKPDMNAIGQTKQVKLGYESSGAGNSSSGQGQSASGGTTSGNKPVTGGVVSGTGKINSSNLAIDPNKNYQATINQVTNQKQVSFALVTNKDLDLSVLYGFPLEVEGLELIHNETYLTGRVRVGNNSSFGVTAQEPYLHFNRIKIAAVPSKNGGGDLGQQALAKSKIKTATGKVLIDDDAIPVIAFGKYNAVLTAFTQGVQIESRTSSTGVVTGTVTLADKSIAGNVQWEGVVSLKTGKSGIVIGKSNAKKTASGARINEAVEAAIPVFISAAPLQSELLSAYYLKTKENNLEYRLNNLYRTDAGLQSTITGDGLHLFSTLHTQLENVASPDMALSIGEVQVSNTALFPVKGTTNVEIPLDNWKIKSTTWNINNGALQLNGNIEAGSVTLPVTGLEISETTIGFGDLKLDKIGIAGVYKLTIDQAQTLTSFGYDKAAQYGTLYDKKYGCWSLSLLPKTATNSLTQLSGLQDLAPADKLNIMNISLYSKGNESRIILKQDHPSLKLNGFADFKPYEIQNGDGFLRVNGALSFNIPGFTGTESAPYSLNYKAVNNQLVHDHQPIAGLKLTTNGIRTAFGAQDQVFTGNTLALKGKLEDKVTNSPYSLTVRFTKSGNTAKLVVDTLAKDVISLGSGQQMNKITGSMALNGQQWSNFKFEGDLTAEGMGAEKNSHMGFEVKGDLVANKAELGVKNMPLPSFLDGSFNLTYDFDKKAVVGSMQLNNVSTPAADFSAAVEMQMGNGQWYLLGSINVNKIKVIPLPLNGAGAAFCLGHTSMTPDKLQIIQPVFHNGELPAAFSSGFSTVNGALFVAAVDFKLPLPNLDIDLGVASVHVGYGIYGNAFVNLDFNEAAPKVKGGVKVGAYVNVNGGASIGIACAGVALGAEINATGTVDMTLPSLKQPGKYLNPKALLQETSLTVDVALTAQLKGSAYVGAGVCNSSCNSVKVWGVTIPPGCHKESIGKTLSVTGGISVTKPAGTLTPSSACIYVDLFGTSYPAINPNTGKRPDNISIPNL